LRAALRSAVVLLTERVGVLLDEGRQRLAQVSDEAIEPAGECELRSAVDGAGHGDLVAPVFGGPLVEAACAATSRRGRACAGQPRRHRPPTAPVLGG
jgi:hypothetical protein